MLDTLTAESFARARVWGEVKEEGRAARVQTKARTRELRPGFIAYKLMTAVVRMLQAAGVALNAGQKRLGLLYQAMRG